MIDKLFISSISRLIIDYYTMRSDELRDFARLGVYERCFDDYDWPKIDVDVIYLEACYQGYLAIVERMIGCWYHTLASKNVLMWGFHYACDAGRVDVVKLLTRVVPARSIGLFLACRNGHYEVVSWILRDRSSWPFIQIFPQDIDPVLHFVLSMISKIGIGPTCLIAACRQSHHHIVKLLIDHGANECICGKSMDAHLAMTESRDSA